jgi:hypothetical protein
MNLRHAAALMLVGWYLILPYRLPNSTKHDVSVSLSHLCKVANFPDRDRCESSRASAIQMIDHPDDLHPKIAAKMRQIGAAGMSEIRQTVSEGKCIASDDPRLKESRPSPLVRSSPASSMTPIPIHPPWSYFISGAN